MKSLSMNRNAWVIFALVALGSVSTGEAYQSSLPRLASSSCSRIPTSLSAKRRLWKPPTFGLLQKPATASSAPALTPLQQSTVTGEMTRPAGSLRRPSLRAPLARLNEMKRNILVKATDKVPSYSKLMKFCATTVVSTCSLEQKHRLGTQSYPFVSWILTPTSFEIFS